MRRIHDRRRVGTGQEALGFLLMQDAGTRNNTWLTDPEAVKIFTTRTTLPTEVRDP
jgi:hypothetical protein